MDKSFTDHCLQNGYKIDVGFKQVGFVLDSLSANQKSFCSIENSNRWLASNFGVNISIFYQENSLPCKSPQFARFHVRDAIGYSGHLIGTSISTMLSIKKASRSKKYFYIYDINEILNSNKIKDIREDRNIIKFTRSEDYYVELTNSGWELSQMIIPDFDINGIMEITNGFNKR